MNEETEIKKEKKTRVKKVPKEPKKENVKETIKKKEVKKFKFVALVKYGDKKYIWDSFNRNYKTLSPYFKNKNWINANVKPFESNDGKDCGQLSMAFLMTFNKFKLKCLNIL